MHKASSDGKQRSHSAKAYLGCDTCKVKNCDLKKAKSLNKFNDYTLRNAKKTKKAPGDADRDRVKEVRKTKIKLTDLCDEDKRRIIELVEELSRYADKNNQLQESLDCSQKTRLEQQDYIIQQAKAHLEEKNFYITEINKHKLKVNALESELKCKLSDWEKQEKLTGKEINYLAKILQKCLREKNQLNEQVNQMSTCLKQSLEAFQKLRIEVDALQLQENQQIKKFKSVSCQTQPIKLSIQKEKYNLREEDMEEEEEDNSSDCNQEAVNSKSSLDIIKDKLEYIYQLLKTKNDTMPTDTTEYLDLDVAAILKTKSPLKDSYRRRAGPCQEGKDDPILEESEDEKAGNGYKFLKPFDQCSKASVQAEKILKKIGNPLNLIVNECAQKLDRNKIGNLKQKEAPRYFDVMTTKVLQTNILQKNDLFKESEDRRNDEDRLLEELFYSDRNFNLDLESMPKSQRKPC